MEKSSPYLDSVGWEGVEARGLPWRSVAIIRPWLGGHMLISGLTEQTINGRQEREKRRKVKSHHAVSVHLIQAGPVPQKHSTVDVKSVSNSHGPRWCSQLGPPRDDPRVGSGT